ncbi:MAG TPA: PaaI family thioesterase [Bacteroidaceae bacterium]|nr:PaaI family thioesterase [Bacteroidaceae bacterium]
MTLKEYLNNYDKFAASNGIQIIEIKKEYAKASMKVTSNHLNAGGICQGGALFTLADLVFAALVNMNKFLSVGINSTIYYHLAGKLGDTLIAEGHILLEHHKIPSAQVSIFNQNNEKLATFSAQAYTKKIELKFSGLE